MCFDTLTAMPNGCNAVSYWADKTIIKSQMFAQNRVADHGSRQIGPRTLGNSFNSFKGLNYIVCSQKGYLWDGNMYLCRFEGLAQFRWET